MSFVLNGNIKEAKVINYYEGGNIDVSIESSSNKLKFINLKINSKSNLININDFKKKKVFLIPFGKKTINGNNLYIVSTTKNFNETIVMSEVIEKNNNKSLSLKSEEENENIIMTKKSNEKMKELRETEREEKIIKVTETLEKLKNKRKKNEPIEYKTKINILKKLENNITELKNRNINFEDDYIYLKKEINTERKFAEKNIVPKGQRFWYK